MKIYEHWKETSVDGMNNGRNQLDEGFIINLSDGMFAKKNSLKDETYFITRGGQSRRAIARGVINDAGSREIDKNIYLQHSLFVFLQLFPQIVGNSVSGLPNAEIFLGECPRTPP